MVRKYSAAIWRPLSRNFTNRKRSKTRAIILHVSASPNAESLFGWFNQAKANSSSHFHVSKPGIVEQYVDADLIAWTSLDANTTTIGVETQGGGTGKWTPQQFDALVKLVAWACRTYGIPARAMTSSKANESGIGWHRLGIDGNFPATGLLRGRNQRGGGEHWSTSRGKICPGDERIQQMPALIQAVLDYNEQLREDAAKPVAGTYTVRSGDTLTSIAAAHGTTVNDLVKLNNISNPNVIRPGQILKIGTVGAPSTPIYHVVKRGETLSGIAKQYKSTVAAIQKANNIKNANLINVGQNLLIPGTATKFDWYTVTGLAKGGTLNGRTGPSMKAKVIHKRKNGFNLKIVKLVKGDGVTWAVTEYGTHYSTAYLTKGRK